MERTDKIKKAYELLEDKESRDIFLKKLLYSITGDFCHIFDLMGSFVHTESDFQWHSFLKRVSKASREKKIIIYGAGGEGEMLCSILESNGIFVEAFCDRNTKLDGLRIKPVISPAQLLERYRKKNDCCIVIGMEMFFRKYTIILSTIRSMKTVLFPNTSCI